MKQYLRILEWMHATLIFALLIPFLYALCEFTASEGTAIFYLKCLLVAVPVAVTGIAAKRAKTLGIYILICAALLAVVYGMVVGLPLLIRQILSIKLLTEQNGFTDMPARCYRAGMLAETGLIAGIRLVDRIKQRRYEEIKKTDPLALYRGVFLDQPSLNNGYFIAMYIAGIFLNAKLLCDTALFSAIAYLFVALAYTFLGTTHHYLTLNKRTTGIPRKRLYTVSGGVLCLYAALLLILILPSFLLTGARRYTDIREWFKDMPLAPAGYEEDMNFQTVGGSAADMSQFFIDPGEPSKFAVLWDALFWGIGIALTAAGIYAIVKIIKKIFRDFRNEPDENGDVIEDLEEKTERRRTVSTAWEQDGETLKIKRLYKRTIRKHRKERPAIYETPSEIEEKAGLAKDAAMQALHKDYERVRYGRQL